MAVPRRIPVRFEDFFPLGAYVMSVEAAADFERRKEGAADVQERDKVDGERVWTVRVIDLDPAARSAEVKVKITAAVAPVPPDVLPGTPFRPVEFEGLTITPWVRDNGKQEYSFRARGMRPVAPATAVRRAGAVAA